MNSGKKMTRRSRSENGLIGMLWSAPDVYGVPVGSKRVRKQIMMEATHQ
jgi:hypothetical protein